MAHSREIRPHAHEIKFVVPATVRIQAIGARTHLEPDPHGGGPFGDEYRTASVYFDNDTLDVFHRRGSYGRSKYRIRRYGDDGLVFLERKMRQPAVLAKRRTSLAAARLRTSRARSRPGSAGHWFHRRLCAQARPVVPGHYARMARSVMRDGEPVRLTLDADLAVQPVERSDSLAVQRRGADLDAHDSGAEVPAGDAGGVPSAGRGIRADAGVASKCPARPRPRFAVRRCRARRTRRASYA